MAKKETVLYAARIFEDVLGEDGKVKVDEDGRRIRKRVPGSEIYISQWVDEEGNIKGYTAEMSIMGKRFFAFLNKANGEVEKIRRALENADEKTVLRIKEMLGVE